MSSIYAENGRKSVGVTIYQISRDSRHYKPKHGIIHIHYLLAFEGSDICAVLFSKYILST